MSIAENDYIQTATYDDIIGLVAESQTVNVGGIEMPVISIPSRLIKADIPRDSAGQPAALPARAPSRRAGVRGRAALTDGVCPIHGGTAEFPCNKFSHLKSDGAGNYNPPALLRFRSFAVGLVKPLVIFSFLGGAGFLAYNKAPDLIGFDSFGVAGSGGGAGANDGTIPVSGALNFDSDGDGKPDLYIDPAAVPGP